MSCDVLFFIFALQPTLILLSNLRIETSSAGTDGFPTAKSAIFSFASNWI